MPIDEVLVSAVPGDCRAAALHQGTLVRLAWRAGDGQPRAGDLFLGRVTGLSPAIGAAFVELGSGPPGLLMFADALAGHRPSQGEPVLVTVLREAEAGKGPKLSARLPVGTDRPVATGGVRPPCRIARGPDPVTELVRAAADAGVERVIVDDAAELSALRAAVAAIAARLRLWLEPEPLFARAGADAAIEQALSPLVPLPGGGRLRIEEATALTSIDVDMGGGQASSAKASALACDLEAAEAIGREILVRDIGGLVVIDFVPLRRPAERARVIDALGRALGDGALACDGERRLRIAGWTRLGLVELSRERRGPSLARRLAEPCAACAGSGWRLCVRRTGETAAGGHAS